MFKRKGLIKTISNYSDEQLIKKIHIDTFGEKTIIVYDTLFLRYVFRFKRDYLYTKVEGFFVDLYLDIPVDVQSRLIKIFKKKDDIEFQKKQEKKRKYL